MADQELGTGGKCPEKSHNFEKERKPSQGQQGSKGKGQGTPSKEIQQNPKNNKKYAVKKRPPPKEVPHRPNDVYIGDRSNFNAQLSKCQKLFEGEHSEVFIHGLGAAIPRAINLALELKKFYQGTVDYTANTSTVKLIDDLIPLDDTTPPSQQFRKVSCVDIRVFRTELGQWLGVTAYEIWVWVTSVTVFSVLLSIKCDTGSGMSWWAVFSPLFVGDGLNAYFVTTVFIRMYIEKKVKPATLRILWSLLQLFLVFLFEFLLCWKLTDPTHFEYSEVMAPLFILSQFIMIRACQLH